MIFLPTLLIVVSLTQSYILSEQKIKVEDIPARVMNISKQEVYSVYDKNASQFQSIIDSKQKKSHQNDIYVIVMLYDDNSVYLSKVVKSHVNQDMYFIKLKQLPNYGTNKFFVATLPGIVTRPMIPKPYISPFSNPTNQHSAPEPNRAAYFPNNPMQNPRMNVYMTDTLTKTEKNLNTWRNLNKMIKNENYQLNNINQVSEYLDLNDKEIKSYYYQNKQKDQNDQSQSDKKFKPKTDGSNEPPHDIDQDFCRNFIAESEDDSLYLKEMQQKMIQDFILNHAKRDATDKAVRGALDKGQESKMIECSTGNYKMDVQDLEIDDKGDDDNGLQLDTSVSKSTYDNFNRVLDGILIKQQSNIRYKKNFFLENMDEEMACIVHSLQKQMGKGNGYKETDQQVKYKFGLSVQDRAKKLMKNKDLALISLTKNTLLLKKNLQQQNINIMGKQNQGMGFQLTSSNNQQFKSIDPRQLGKLLADNSNVINKVIISDYIRYHFDQMTFVSEKKSTITNNNKYSANMISQIQNVLTNSNPNPQRLANLHQNLKISNKQNYKYYIRISIQDVDKISGHLDGDQINEMSGKMMSNLKLLKKMDKKQEKLQIYKNELSQIMELINE